MKTFRLAIVKPLIDVKSPSKAIHRVSLRISNFEKEAFEASSCAKSACDETYRKVFHPRTRRRHLLLRLASSRPSIFIPASAFGQVRLRDALFTRALRLLHFFFSVTKPSRGSSCKLAVLRAPNPIRLRLFFPL